MPFYRVTMIFNWDLQPPTGFSERYDFEAGSDDAAQARANQFVTARLKTMSSSWFTQAVRLSKLAFATIGGKAKVVQRGVLLCTDLILKPGKLTTADTPAAAVYYQWQFQDVPKPSVRMFRGIPDDAWDGGKVTDAWKGKAEVMQFTMQTLGVARTTINTAGTAIEQHPLHCWVFKRIASKRVGRPFGPLHARRKKKTSP